MNSITQAAKRRQAVVKLSMRKGKSYAAAKYGVSLSSVKRWCRRYDGDWRSLKDGSHRPKTHPSRHTAEEEQVIRKAYEATYLRYGWDGAYDAAVKCGYKRSFSGMVYATKRMGLGSAAKIKRPRTNLKRYPELTTPGEKVQIDVKEVPYTCLRGDLLRNGKHLYQWTAIDECTRLRFVYGFEEHTPENTVVFLRMLTKAFPFRIRAIQTDNGTEFTYKFISDTGKSPMDRVLEKAGIEHILIPPRTPWQNGKVERSHRNDQRYFYDWERFRSVDDLNEKLKHHLEWSNNKTMRTLGRKSPLQLLKEKTAT